MKPRSARRRPLTPSARAAARGRPSSSRCPSWPSSRRAGPGRRRQRDAHRLGEHPIGDQFDDLAAHVADRLGLSRWSRQPGPPGAGGPLRAVHYLRAGVTDRCNFRCVYCLRKRARTGSPARTSSPRGDRPAGRHLRAHGDPEGAPDRRRAHHPRRHRPARPGHRTDPGITDVALPRTATPSAASRPASPRRGSVGSTSPSTPCAPALPHPHPRRRPAAGPQGHRRRPGPRPGPVAQRGAARGERRRSSTWSPMPGAMRPGAALHRVHALHPLAPVGEGPRRARAAGGGLDLRPEGRQGGGRPGPALARGGAGPSGGFISPLSEHFCATCNRPGRATATCAPASPHEDTPSLRDLLRGGASDGDLAAAIRAMVPQPEGHSCDLEGGTPFEGVMTGIGG